MATGYTIDIEKGITFKQFVLSCARAFGPLISMRNDSYDTPIPDEIKPDTYNFQRLQRAQKELKKLKKLTLSECKENAEKEYKKRLAARLILIEKNKELKNKYNNMLKYVNDWFPPTDDHKDLKDFMINQIIESIKSDCVDINNEEIKKETGQQWLKNKIEDCFEEIDYHTKEYEKEVKRAKYNTKWIQELKKSLN